MDAKRWLAAALFVAVLTGGVAIAAVQSAQGEGPTAAEACANAKFEATRAVQQMFGVEPDRLTDCQCSARADGSSVCTVDAYYTPKS
jgi:hypothetical protein